jgi:AraC-like DNA-binding protein
VVRIIHQVAPDVRNINRIDLKHAAQCEPSVYQAYFHCPVNFQAERNTMYGDNQLLDGVLPGSLPQAHTSAEATIRRHLLGDGLSPPLAMQAAMLLRQRIALLSEGLEGLAKHLHLHPRALQRELSKAGTSYSALVAHIRHDQASAMLRDTVLDIDSIALKLGFSERRSFTLAFRQWQGCTPSDYRRSIRTQATTGHISTTGIFH